MKNKPKLDVLFQPPRFKTHLLMVFPVEKLLTDNLKTYSLMDPVKFLEIQGMTHVVLYKYINCTVDKLLALALVTNYITNYSIITIITTIIIIFR